MTTSFCGGGTFITFLKINIFQFRFLGRSMGVSCTLLITETRKKCIYSYKGTPTTKWQHCHFVVQKWGFLPIFFWGEGSGFYGLDGTWHNPRPAQKAKLKNIHFWKSYKGTPTTKWQIVISWSKNGVFPTFWGEGKFHFLVSMVHKVHDTPLDLPKKRN